MMMTKEELELEWWKAEAHKKAIEVENCIDKVNEAHADLEHEIWASWMRYMFSRGVVNPDGSWTMPKEFAERWKRQMNTQYNLLSEQEQLSDKEQVMKHLVLLTCGTIDRAGGTESRFDS